MRDLKELYDILGLPETATREEIKHAYHTKAKTMHPDVGGNEEDFKAIGKAYDILMDDEKMHNYKFSGNADESIESLAVQQVIASYINFCRKIDIERILYVNITNSLIFELQNNIKEIKVFSKSTKKLIKQLRKKEKQCEFKNNKLSSIFLVQIDTILNKRSNVARDLRILNRALVILKEGILEQEIEEIRVQQYRSGPMPTFFQFGGGTSTSSF